MFKVQDNSSSNVEVVNLYKQCIADLSISLKTWEEWCLTTLLQCSNVLEWCIPVDWIRYAHVYAVLEEEWCLVLRLDTLHFWTHGCQSSSPNWAPHWVPKSVTSISLYQLVFLNKLQLAAGATGLFSQGMTAVVHGCSVCALGPRVNLTHSWRGGKQCHLWLSCWSRTEYTLEGTLTKGHKQAAFHVRFIEKPVLERRVVSQQYNGTQHTGSNSGMWIHKTLSQSINQHHQHQSSAVMIIIRMRIKTRRRIKTLQDNSSSL